MLCSRCKKNVATVFMTKMEGDKQIHEGLCLMCAKELGIAPVNDMLEKMGIRDEDLEMLSSQLTDMNKLMEENGFVDPDDEMTDENGEPIESSAPAAPLDFIKNMFNMGAQSNASADEGYGSSSNNSDTQTKDKKPPMKKKSILDTYATNLTYKAALGEVDRVIGRDNEIERTIQILNRRSKNNPVLLGEPGVGKTAVAEGLAVRIHERKVPPKLLNYQLYLLDFTAIVAGTQFRGQFEARLKSIINEAAKAGNVILVIDEIHNIVAAGDAEGAMNAANILKPALAKGDIQIIGATTLTEYRKHIEKDSALERRFQPVIIDEPSVEDSIEILRGIKDYYEKYHKVKIPDNVIVSAVKLSERYVTERFLPDKAIDVIDEACSRVNLKNRVLFDVALLKEEIKKLEQEETALTDAQNYEEASKVKSRLIQLQNRLAIATAECDKIEVTIDDIASVIEGWTKIPVHAVTEAEAEKLLLLEERLHQRVIGQDKAIDAVSRAIRRGRSGVNLKKRPVSFIFAGPTGVGKTELVKTIAEAMFDTEDALIRIDMSEYMEKHSVSKLIGSPPGYVGYDDAGQLTEKIRRKPYSVILLDEIEKAHPEVFNLFLQILDDGRVADSHGKMVNFENTIIIMTTNAGSDLHNSNLGFVSDEQKATDDRVLSALQQQFRPEFLNRIDEIIAFSLLTRDELLKIIDLMLKDVSLALTDMGAELVVTDRAKQFILDHGYDVKYGARPLRRAIQTHLEDALSTKVLKGEIISGSKVTADVSDDKITVTVL